MFTAKVSKMLSPIASNRPRTDKGQTQEGWEWREVRGQYLRDLLGVDDASPVLGREVRDASEHFDERLVARRTSNTIFGAASTNARLCATR